VFRFETLAECDAAYRVGMKLDHLPCNSPELHAAIAKAAAYVRELAGTTEQAS
jgi:hypothetical protein